MTRLAPWRWLLLVVVIAAGLGLWPGTSAAASCADYPNQAAAQQAGDTRDADGDGIYCENLPCPCSSQAPTGKGHRPSQSGSSGPSGCIRPRRVQRISFSATTYPNIRRHYLAAVTRGWPRTLVVNRSGADQRRARLLESYPTRPGFDRDEYPPAVGRGHGKGLERGSDPTGCKGDVPRPQQRKPRPRLGSGRKLHRVCNGTKFRYAFF